MLFPAGALLAVPKATLQLLVPRPAGSSAPAAAAALAATFAQLVGITWIMQAMFTLIVQVRNAAVACCWPECMQTALQGVVSQHGTSILSCVL